MPDTAANFHYTLLSKHYLRDQSYKPKKKRKKKARNRRPERKGHKHIEIEKERD